MNTSKPFGDMTAVMEAELTELHASVQSALVNPSLRYNLPSEFGGIDWADEDELPDALFEATVETIAARHGLNDEHTAILGYMADTLFPE